MCRLHRHDIHHNGADNPIEREPIDGAEFLSLIQLRQHVGIAGQTSNMGRQNSIFTGRQMFCLTWRQFGMVRSNGEQRLLAQHSPQTGGNCAEARIRDDPAIAFARPVCRDNVNKPPGPC